MFVDGRRRRLLYLVIVLAMFTDGFNGTVVSVVLPDIASTFNVSAGDSSWIFSVYFLAMASLILVFGKVCGEGHVKNVLLLGLGSFSLGALLCSISVSYPMFLVSRCIEGLGASMIVSSAFMLPVRFLPKGYVALGFVSTSAGMALGATIGAIVGGIVSSYMSWEFAFAFKAIFAMVGMAVVWRTLPKDEVSKIPAFDRIGSVLLILSMSMGLYSLEAISSSGFTMRNSGLIIVSIVLLMALLVHCLRSNDPVVNVRLFTIRSMDACLLVLIISNLCYVGCLYLMPLYVTKVMGLGGIENGTLTFLMSVINLAMCLRVGTWIVRYGCRSISILSCITLVGASVALALVDLSPYLMLLSSSILLGMMWGFGGGAFSTRLIDNVPEGDRCSGAAIASFFTYFGGAIGTTLYTVFFNIGSGAASAHVMDLPSADFMNGYMVSTIVGIALCVLALFLAWVIRDGNAVRNEI